MISPAKKILSVAWTALLPASALAQGPASLAPDWLQSALGVALVLFIIIGGAWLARRASRLPGERGGALRVVAAVGVGPRERVVVVEVAGAWLILGVAPGRVNALHALPAQTTSASTPATDHGHFAAWLKQFMERGRAG